MYFFQFLVIKTLDLDPHPDSLKMLDPDPFPCPGLMNPNPEHVFYFVER